MSRQHVVATDNVMVSERLGTTFFRRRYDGRKLHGLDSTGYPAPVAREEEQKIMKITKDEEREKEKGKRKKKRKRGLSAGLQDADDHALHHQSHGVEGSQGKVWPSSSLSERARTPADARRHVGQEEDRRGQQSLTSGSRSSSARADNKGGQQLLTSWMRPKKSHTENS